jgi:hypothetical protein
MEHNIVAANSLVDVSDKDSVAEKMASLKSAEKGLENCMSDFNQSKTSVSSESSFGECNIETWQVAEAKRARLHVDKLLSNSKLQNVVHDVPTFTQKECVNGKLLGKGSFAVVHEVHKIELSNTTNNDKHSKQRILVAQNCVRSNGEAKYAVKRLASGIIKDKEMYIQGVVYMVIGKSPAFVFAAG